MLLVALAIKLTSRGPVVYRSLRPGIGGMPFACFKFRTMYVDAHVRQADLEASNEKGGAIFKIRNDPRVTRVGRLLRRFSIDELPQLFNVLKGDMSIVGPRPERPEFVEMFERSIDRYVDRHRVKAGITGWAQVHGLRGKTSLADRIEWDNFYIENWSLWLDLKILVMTLGAVFYPAE